MKNKNKFYTINTDPGKLTGISLFCFENGQATLLWAREVDEFEVDFLIEETIALYAPDIEIVNERFYITEKTYKLPDAPWSIEKAGVLKYMARKYNVKYYWQSPTDAKNFVPDERLKNLDLWYKDEKGNNGDGHANDSLRHAILHMVKNHRWVPEGLLIDEDDEE